MVASTSTRWLAFLVIAVLVGALLYELWPLIDDNDPPPSLESLLAVAAALLLLTLPHTIAWLGRRARWLLRVAGILGITITLLSVVGFTVIIITIPLVGIPSVIYLKRGASAPDRPARVAGLTMAVIALAIGATASFFLTEDPRCSITVRQDGELVHSTPPTCDVSGSSSSSGTLGPEVVEWSGTSDTIAWHESLLSLALSGISIALCVRARAAADGSEQAAPAGVAA